MPTHNPNEPERGKVDASHGFERSDARVAGVAVFLTALTVFVAVVGLLSYGIGKVINARLAKEDAAKSKWAKTVDVRPLGNMPSSPELENKMAGLTQQLPAPQVTDRRRPPGYGRPSCQGGPAAGALQLGRSGAGLAAASENSDRTGDGVDCAAWIAGGPAGGTCAAADRRTEAGRGRAADQWVCPHRL